jgi:putative membrane protein (TIGR04086 family)
MKTRIRWGRVVLAAVAAEAAVILLIVAISTIKPEFSESAGYYLAPPASAVATFLMALWVARKLKSDFILHGILVGLVGVVVTAGFIFAAKPEDRLMYGVSYILRIIGGYLGGVVARKTDRRQDRLSHSR